MDEAQKLLDYLPIRFKDSNEQEYIKFLWDSFKSNYENEKFQFSFIAYHMLFMCFVYFNVWQIKKIEYKEYKKITLGFNDCFLNPIPTSPFIYSQEFERRIFILFKYLGLTDDKIGNYKKIVDDRNNAAHSNGNIFFKSQDSLDDKISEIIRYTEEIQQYTKSTIQKCFKQFLIESQNDQERQYAERKDQINELLIHKHYLSQKDIDICLEYDISKLSNQPNYGEIEKIFDELKNEYAEE